MGTPASISASVGLQDLGNHADGIGELVLGGDHRKQGALGERAVADLAALRSAHTARFAGAVRREVILVHIALALGRVDGVKTLPLVEHAERGDGKRLGLTALEQAGAVAAGQFMEEVLPLVQASPEALDKIDADQMVDELAQRMGVPSSVIRSDEQVAEIRRRRAEEAESARRAEEAKTLAEQAAKIGGIRTGDTLAGALVNASLGGAPAGGAA